MATENQWVAWCLEYKDAAHRKWTLFRGLWWTKKEAVKFARDWMRATGNGGLVACRVFKVIIEPSGTVTEI